MSEKATIELADGLVTAIKAYVARELKAAFEAHGKAQRADASSTATDIALRALREDLDRVARRADEAVTRAAAKSVDPATELPAAMFPMHEWDGTRLRFEQAPGVWGPWVELQGARGDQGQPGQVPNFSLKKFLKAVEVDGGTALGDHTGLDGGGAGAAPAVAGFDGGGASSQASLTNVANARRAG